MSATDMEKSSLECEPKVPHLNTNGTSSEKNSVENDVATEESSDNTFPEGGARAWGVAAGCSFVLFATFGYVNAFGVYQEYYETHQLSSQTPSTISWIGSIQVFFLFAGSLFGGPLFDRYGAKVIWPAAILHIFAVMMTSICKEWYQFFLAQGILDGICMGLTMAPCMAATGQYFNKNRGAALGLAVAGSSVGGVVFPIALSKMLANEKLGFGWSVRICGFLMLAVVLPACAMVRARLPPRSGKFFLPSAFRELPYVCLIGSVFLIMLGLFTPFFYLPTFAVEHGMSTQLASYLVAILNGSSFFGRVLGGLLADKFGRLNLLMGAGVCTGVLIFCWQKMTTNATMILFAVLYGFFSGAIVSLMSAALAQVPKDARNIGTYMGMGMALVSIATLIGPPINGALVTRFGEFEQSSTMSGVFAVVGGLSVILTKFVAGKTFEKY